MPRSIPDDQIRKLRKTGAITNKDGSRYKRSLHVKQPKAPLTSEERQARALEAIGAEIQELLKANSQNAFILLEMIKKLKAETIRIPEWPKQAEAWDHTITERDSNGKAVKMRTEVVK